MPLQRAVEPAGEEAGLWHDPDWTPDMSGTFAVVIGISSYHHLVGGDRQRAQETFGLQQLHVSALTAWHLFSWLRDEYAYPGAPLARVWLLLSPAPAELAHDAGMAAAAPTATWDACQNAIKAWYRSMTQELSAGAAAGSRALFSFCGHGFEVSGNQILLPDDYMSPDNLENPDNAISTRNLLRAMASAPVPTQLFFPDACRNDVDALLRYEVAGTKILPERPRSAANMARVAPILNATASGSTAWQPKDPATGLSLYGEALLEALRGTGDITVDWSIDPGDIRMYPIQDYLNRRIPRLFLDRYNQQVLQPIRIGGESDNAIVTKVRRPSAVVTTAEESTAAGTVIAFPDESAGAGSSGSNMPLAGATPAATPTPSREREVEMAEVVAAPFPIRMDGVGGSETMAEMWNDARLYSMRERVWRSADALHLHDVLRDESTRAYRISFGIDDSEGDHWLELHDGERTFACLLPGAPAAPPRYAIELARQERDDGPPRVTQFLPSLALDNPGATGTAVALWERSRRGLPIAPRAIERAFDRAEPGSLAATILLLVALRLRMTGGERAPEWVELVTAGGAAAPDDAILAAEVAMARGETADPSAAFPGLDSLLAHGLPRFAETLELALGQLADILLSDEPPPTGPDTPGSLELLTGWLRQSSRAFRTGGLLTTFSGPPELIDVTLATPPRVA